MAKRTKEVDYRSKKIVMLQIELIELREQLINLQESKYENLCTPSYYADLNGLHPSQVTRLINAGRLNVAKIKGGKKGSRLIVLD